MRQKMLNRLRRKKTLLPQCIILFSSLPPLSSITVPVPESCYTNTTQTAFPSLWHFTVHCCIAVEHLCPYSSKKQVCLGSWSLLQPQLSSRYKLVLDDLPGSRIQAVGAKWSPEKAHWERRSQGTHPRSWPGAGLLKPAVLREAEKGLRCPWILRCPKVFLMRIPAKEQLTGRCHLQVSVEKTPGQSRSAQASLKQG